MLTYCVGKHWHPLVSELLSLGFRWEDMFTPTLPFSDLVSIVMAPQPNGPLKLALNNGWSQTDHLLANLGEANAGIATQVAAYDRPSQNQDESPMDALFPAEAYEWDDFEKMLEQRYAAAKRGAG